MSNPKTGAQPGDFHLGWAGEIEAEARQALLESGLPKIFNAPFAADDRPLPEAFTLASNIFWYTDQGPVGSCFADAGAQAGQISMSSAISAGAPFTDEQFSRAFAWHEGRKNDGTLGYRADGGSISGVMKAGFEKGYCPESLLPYKPSRSWLEQTPTQAAYDAAALRKLIGIVYPQSVEEEQRSIYNGLPPEIGIWWPYGWDQGQIDQHGRTTGVGRGVYGHALVKIGWANAGVWDNYRWWHIKNSHGPIYPVLSPEMAAKVEGYATIRPDRDYCFWVREDHMQAVIAKGNSELVAAAGIEGIEVRHVYSWRLR